MVNFFQEKLYILGLGQYRLLQHVSLEDISVGMVGFNSSRSQLFSHFFRSNDDNLKLMAAIAMKDHLHELREEEEEVSQPFFAISSPLYLMTLVTLVILCVFLTLLGFCIKKMCSNNYHEKGGDEGANENDGGMFCFVGRLVKQTLLGTWEHCAAN